MDHLDHILQTAGPLLRRVDDVLTTTGAPPGHELWTELRRVRLLPGDAVYAVAALRPSELAEVVPELRADARTYAAVAEDLPRPAGWTGDAADAFAQARDRAAEHLSGAPESLEERLEATADLADALADWMIQLRADLARTLADGLASPEALDLSGYDPDPTGTVESTAAATLAAPILKTIADSYAHAADLLDASAPLANPQP
jgi:hypothetical protein